MIAVTDAFILVDGHAIERFIVTPDGDIIVHHAECPACKAGEEPTEVSDEDKRALIAAEWRPSDV